VCRRDCELYPELGGRGDRGNCPGGWKEGKGIITRDHFLWGFGNVGRSVAKEGLGTISRAGCEGDRVKCPGWVGG
jgi:hypothetical protein